MRITIVLGPFFPAPPAPTGAVEYVWHGLAEAFARRGHEVTVLCRAHESQGPDETIKGVHYIRRLSPSKTGSLKRDLVKDLLYSFRMLPLLPVADILVTNAFFFPPLASVLRRKAGTHVVNVQRMPKGQLWLYDRAARLAVVSRAVEEAVGRERPAALPRVRVIPNPIDIQTFVPPAGGRLRVGSGTIVFTGRVHPEKGIHMLVAAWRGLAERYPGLGLQIVGPQTVATGGGGDDYLRELRRLAAGLPLEIAEPVYGRAALASVLQRADYYCYPSLADQGETMGVAPLEAMGTGLAPVVSDLACFRDFVEPGVNGLVFDHRGSDAVERLTQALETLVAEPELSARLGGAASLTAQRFGYEAVAERYLRDFEELLSAGRGKIMGAEA